MLTCEIQNEVLNFGVASFGNPLLLFLEVLEDFVMDVVGVGEVNGSVHTDSEDSRHGSGFRVLLHVPVNTCARNVSKASCVRPCDIV